MITLSASFQVHQLRGRSNLQRVNDAWVNQAVPLPVHGHLSTPPGSIPLHIFALLPANGEIAASFGFQRVQYARLRATITRCDWRRAPDLSFHEFLVGGEGRISQ